MDSVAHRLLVPAVVLMLIITACSGEAATVTTASPGTAPSSTTNSPPDTGSSPTTSSSTTTSLAVSPTFPDRVEPPNHVNVVDPSQSAEYRYHEFLQVPFGAAWGPDGYFYLADLGGRHVVRVGPDGTMDDVGIWRDPSVFVGDGPKDVAFGPDGSLYVSEHNRVYRVTDDGFAEELDLGGAAPSGGLAFGPEGDLYFGERHSGLIYRYGDGQTEVIARGLERPDGLFAGRDGMLYIVQLGPDMIMRLDPATGSLTEFFDGADLGGVDLAYLAVDSDGDIWVRGKGVLYQVSVDGDIKPFTVDGIRADHHTLGINGLAAGLAFDDQGGLWLASYLGMLVYLAPEESGPDDHVFTTEVVTFGYAASGLAVASDGTVFTHNFITGELWRIGLDGIAETIWRAGTAGGDFIHLAIDPASDLLYVTKPSGEVVTLDAVGVETHVAWIAAFGLTVGNDGTLYAIELMESASFSEARAVVRVTGTDQVEDLTSELGGQPIAGQSLVIGAAPEGVYVFSRTTGLLYLVDTEGNSTLIADAGTASQEIPYSLAATSEGMPYLFGYGAYEVGEGGQLTRIAGGLTGDPTAASFNSEGSLFYIAEAGAITMIPLSRG